MQNIENYYEGKLGNWDAPEKHQSDTGGVA
jgi:hypothetical protein